MSLLFYLSFINFHSGSGEETLLTLIYNHVPMSPKQYLILSSTSKSLCNTLEKKIWPRSCLSCTNVPVNDEAPQVKRLRKGEIVWYRSHRDMPYKQYVVNSVIGDYLMNNVSMQSHWQIRLVENKKIHHNVTRRSAMWAVVSKTW